MVETTNRDVILLPIYPEYANAIMDGDKKVEFRKLNIPNKVKRVVVYSTAPEKKIIGYFTVSEIEKAKPKILWDNFSNVGCVEKHFFSRYYKDSKKGLAIKIKEVFKLKRPLKLTELNSNLPPQSFRYLSKNEWNKIFQQKHT